MRHFEVVEFSPAIPRDGPRARLRIAEMRNQLCPAKCTAKWTNFGIPSPYPAWLDLGRDPSKERLLAMPIP